MALHLHRAVRTDALVESLGGLLAVPLADPFAQEVVVVPEHGVERWLAQRLSHRLGTPADGAGGGVCAGVRFVRPRSLVTLLTGRDEDDPWLATHLVWPLLGVLDECLGEPWAGALAHHLGADADGDLAEVRSGRRYSVALRLARLLARYGEQRPTLLTDWREGRDEDGAGRPLPPDLRWQAELYRRLLEAVPEPPPDVRHEQTVARLRSGDPALDLPGRLSLFGHTRIAVTEVGLLRALATHREVHLWLPQPSPAAWDAVAASACGVVPRDEDDSALAIRHPLLASLGRDARELVRVVGREDVVDETPAPSEEPAPTTVLGWLQHDLAANRVPSAAERAERTVAPDDRTLALHACHGPARQVEVLREVLVGLLEDDPTLEPRDVVVMCPDVEVYAPLVSAAFGLGDHGTDAVGVDTHPAHRLRVGLADRGLRATNPLLQVAEQLVALVGGRATAGQVLDLLGLAPVRRRFGLDDDDLETIHGWVASSGIRWGLDAPSRAPYHLGREAQNTWEFGLDRLLAGVAVSADGPLAVGCALPLDDVGSGSVDLAGRFAEAVERVGGAVRGFAACSSAGEWTAALRESVLDLSDVPFPDAWQVGDLDRTLGEAARLAPEDLPLRISDVRVLLGDRLEPRPGRTSFRTGALTVCTLVPMRSVPHRVVCLVGLDDDSFPRHPALDGDDVLARRPLTGERDARSEDRQLLLDAIMAATERLVVLWTGADERTGERRPPAVPVGELLDAAAETVAVGTDPAALGVTQHPLQPFDARNFTGVRPLSFDRAALDGALAAAGARTPEPGILTAPLPAHPLTEVPLADLVGFGQNPARTFLRDRLGISVPWEAEELLERMPVDTGGLADWAIGDRGLTARLAGRPREVVWQAELMRGELPPGALAQHTLRPIAARAEGLVAWIAAWGDLTAARTLDVAVDLGERRVTGAVSRVLDTALLDVSYGRPGARAELRAWTQLLALTVDRAVEGRPWTATVVGSSTRGVEGCRLGPVDPGLARELLTDLLRLLDLGRTAPLPLPPKTSRAWAERWLRSAATDAAARRGQAMAAARAVWEGDRFPGERSDGWWRRLHGAESTVADLLRPVAGGDTDLPALAPRVWAPLLDHRSPL